MFTAGSADSSVALFYQMLQSHLLISADRFLRQLNPNYKQSSSLAVQDLRKISDFTDFKAYVSFPLRIDLHVLTLKLSDKEDPGDWR